MIFQDLFKDKEKGGDEYRNKKIHVRSKDPLRIARQFEKAEKKSSKSSSKYSSSGGGGSGKRPVAPPPQKINQICKVCGKEPYVVERIVAEKSWWCKNCFRCKVCNKILRWVASGWITVKKSPFTILRAKRATLFEYI